MSSTPWVGFNYPPSYLLLTRIITVTTKHNLRFCIPLRLGACESVQRRRVVWSTLFAKEGEFLAYVFKSWCASAPLHFRRRRCFFRCKACPDPRLDKPVFLTKDAINGRVWCVSFEEYVCHVCMLGVVLVLVKLAGKFAKDSCWSKGVDLAVINCTRYQDNAF